MVGLILIFILILIQTWLNPELENQIWIQILTQCFRMRQQNFRYQRFTSKVAPKEKQAATNF